MILKRKYKPESDYTVISNAFVRDPSLSLKAKGMLCMLLSLPDDWNMSIKGLGSFYSDGMIASRAALSELKDLGYIETERKRDVNGAFGEMTYTVTDKSYGYHGGKPGSENRNWDKRNSGYRNSDNGTLLNKKIPNTKEINTDPLRRRERPEGMSEYAFYNSNDDFEL